MTPLYSTPALFLIYVALFIGVILAFEGLRQLLSRGENASEARNRRMRIIQRGTTTEEIFELLNGPATRQRKGSGSPLNALRALLAQSGLRIGVRVFVLSMAVIGAAAFVISARFVPMLMAAPISLVLGLGLPVAILSGLRGARLEKLTEQLPDALDLMARGLKVGHPLSVTVENVASEMRDPIGSEFGIIQDQVQYGDDIVTAFRDFAERTGVEDVRYLAVSVGIQHGTGGSLGRVLNVLSKVIRDRAVMRKKIKAISSEGRLSGLILTALPFGIFASIHFTTPSFYGDVQDDPKFMTFMIIIGTLIVAQGYILHRLVHFKF